MKDDKEKTIEHFGFAGFGDDGEGAFVGMSKTSFTKTGFCLRGTLDRTGSTRKRRKGDGGSGVGGSKRRRGAEVLLLVVVENWAQRTIRAGRRSKTVAEVLLASGCLGKL